MFPAVCYIHDRKRGVHVPRVHVPIHRQITPYWDDPLAPHPEVLIHTKAIDPRRPCDSSELSTFYLWPTYLRYLTEVVEIILHPLFSRGIKRLPFFFPPPDPNLWCATDDNRGMEGDREIITRRATLVVFRSSNNTLPNLKVWLPLMLASVLTHPDGCSRIRISLSGNYLNIFFKSHNHKPHELAPR